MNITIIYPDLGIDLMSTGIKGQRVHPNRMSQPPEPDPEASVKPSDVYTIMEIQITETLENSTSSTETTKILEQLTPPMISHPQTTETSEPPLTPPPVTNMPESEASDDTEIYQHQVMMGREKRLEYAASFEICYQFRLLYYSGTQYPIMGALRMAYPYSNTTRRCYCILTRLPFFELHFGVLNRLDRLTKSIGELDLDLDSSVENDGEVYLEAENGASASFEHGQELVNGTMETCDIHSHVDDKQLTQKQIPNAILPFLCFQQYDSSDSSSRGLQVKDRNFRSDLDSPETEEASFSSQEDNEHNEILDWA
ncbi:hypothetical protein Lser_V15G16995 [Lactuca serriola]